MPRRSGKATRRARASGRRLLAAGFALVAAFALVLIATSIGDSQANGVQSFQNADPRGDTPVAIDGRAYAGTQRGDRIVVGGTFTTVEPGNGEPAISQPHLYVFDANTGELDSEQFSVDDRVSVVIPAAEDDMVFVGGSFSTIDDTPRHKLAKLDLDSGEIDASFVAHTNGQVKDLALVGDTLYLTGGFTQVNEVERLGLAAVDARTGEVRSEFDMPLESYIGQVAGTIGQRLGATPDGSTLVVMHRARLVGGQERRGVAMIDISGAPTLLPWQTDFWNATSVVSIVDGEVSPDGTYLVVGGGWGDGPPWRDTAIAFPVAGAEGVEPLWVTRNHDSTFAVGIDDNAVYIGGHFCWTEGPTTPEPWANPAPQGNCPNKTRRDPTMVYRDTFAALDPATGKAIKYAPDTDARNGIRSIEIVPAGMLVGGDQTWTADVRTGRSAFFDIRTARENLALSGTASQSSTWSGYDPDLAIDANRDKQLFTGTIAATESELQPWWQVDLGAVHDVSTISLWTRTDCCSEEFSDVWVFTSETAFASDDPAVLSQDPTVQATLLDGEQERRVTLDAWTSARYVRVQLDGTGQLFLSEVAVYRYSGVGSPDDIAPSASVDTPAENQELGAPVAVTGTASDNEAVAAVVVEVRNRDTNDWLNADGSWGPWTELSATLGAPGSQNTSWSLDIGSIEPGRYKVFARAVDSSGNAQEKVERRFIVVSDDGAAPTLVFASPADGATEPGPAVTFEGTVTDDVGVESVMVAVRDRNTGQWLRDDGSFGAWLQLHASLDEPGAPATGWSLAADLAPGSYAIFVSAFDATGNSSEEQSHKFVVGSDDEAPTTSVSSPVAGAQMASGPFSFEGNAADNTSVVWVRISVRNRDTKEWLRPDGTWGRWSLLDATLADPGTAATGWSYSLAEMPPGSYKVYVSASDQSDNVSTEAETAFSVN